MIFATPCAPRKSALVLALLLTLSGPLALVAQTPVRFHSTDIHPDHTVTFSYKDSAATKVTLALDGVAEPIPMGKDANGVWTVTTPPLTPEIYGYHFEADGDRRFDPANPRMTLNLVSVSNMLLVPGDTPQPWEDTNVPHGTLHRYIYTTGTVLGLPENQSGYFVYTPPATTRRRRSPTQSSISSTVGPIQTQDGLPSDTPTSSSTPSLPRARSSRWSSSCLSAMETWPSSAVTACGIAPATIDHNTDLFTKALLTEVMPRIESEYHVSKDRNDRAIAGLSMGGLESLEVGLTHTGQFAWIGGFSSAFHNLDYSKVLASLDPKAANLRLLWIACGTEDSLIDPNRKLVEFLKTKEMPVTQIETPGLHTWMVWRDNLIHFTPLLFQQK